MTTERLQKVLAHAGIGSRRHCETLITAGAVQVNGQVITTLGTRVDPQNDEVKVHGRRILSETLIYLALYKPLGYVSTAHDQYGRPKVTDLVAALPQRLYPVGRLDYDTEGLLLITNDGELAYRLTHPKYYVPKTYLAEVQGRPNPTDLRRLAVGIPLEDGLTAPAQVHLRHKGPKSLVEITIHEGRNRQVRRMLAAIGHPVLTLKRISFDGLTLDGLSPGKFRRLTTAELLHLRYFVGLTEGLPK